MGRFQPFHNGHLSVIQTMLKEMDDGIIGIGSAEDNYQPENPFTASERFEMIEESLLDEGISKEKFYILPVRNINNYALWVSHLELLLPKFDKIYTGSPLIQRLFLLHGKYEVHCIQKTIPVSGTDIRKKILAKDDTWKTEVPHAVARKIEAIQGENRLKHLTTA